jgi:integrase
MVTTRNDRKNGKYRVRMRVGGIKFDRSFSLAEDAKNYEAKLRREKELVESGLGAPHEKILIVDYAATWLSMRKKEVQGPSYSADEKNLRLHILPYMGTRPLQSVTTVEWRQFLEFVTKQEELSNATHNRIRSTIQALYKDSIANGILNVNPIDGVPPKSEKIKIRKSQLQFWHTDEEIIRFLESACTVDTNFKLYAYIALNTGARVSEICAIEWGDIEFDAGVILLNKIYEQQTQEVKFRTKSGEGVDRYVPINPSLKVVLIEHKGKLTERIVKLSPDQIGRVQDKVIRSLRIKRVTPHGLRKTFATWYRRHRGSKDDLQAILGHSSSMVTDIYAKTTKQSVANMALEGVSAPKTFGENVVEFRGERE